jgi:AmmeMemoRadiSam system protein B
MDAVTTRPPAVAGRFYPGRAGELRATVDRLLDAVQVPDEPLAPAYVVPHAGYRYSGPTAAPVYARLRAHADEVARVVLIGPAHYARLRGCAVPTVDRWVTPLGDVPLDAAGCRALAADRGGLATADDEPHRPEHSLEVQLPFVQRALPAGVPVLPVVAGRATAEEIADLLALVAPGEAGTVLLCSTDLSHYHDDATARELDRRTVAAVLAGEPDRIGPRDACGVFGLRGTVAYAGRAGWRARLLALATSADTAGTPDRVVGYSAFAFDESGTARNDPAGSTHL